MKLYLHAILFLMIGLMMPWAMGDEIPIIKNGQEVYIPIETNYPEGVNVTVEGDTIRIQNGNDTEQQVHITHIKIGLGEKKIKSTLWYRAEIRSEEATAPVCLESLCYTNRLAKYFSRALNETVEGTTDWRSSQTPFFLQETDYVIGMSLGVYFQGKGTVYLRNLEFSKVDGHSSTSQLGPIIGIAGGIFGALVGIWGALAGVLVSRGRAKKFVLTSAVIFVVIGAVCFLIGLIFLLTGAPKDLCYGLLLPGIIVTGVVGSFMPVLNRCYMQHETARLTRMNQAESL